MRMPFGIELVFLIVGPLIWFAHYLFIYSVNALRCARASVSLGAMWLGVPVSGWIIVLSSVLALTAMVWMTMHQHRRIVSMRRPAFHSRLTTALCLLSAMAVVWQTLPVFLVNACG